MSSAEAGAESPVPMGAEEKRLVSVRVIGELRHPHLIVMRRLDEGLGFEPDLAGGRPLSELLKTRGNQLPFRIWLRILLDALSGLAALHRARADNGQSLDFVHGEVSPRNIIVGRDGVARLVPLVKGHWSWGAPISPESDGYTAPEKLLGDACGQGADVFSVGVLLWEAMEGKRLFEGLSVEEIVTKLVGGKVHRPLPLVDAPWSGELSQVVLRALAADPGDRWENVGVMGADIETIAEGHVAKTSELVPLVTGRDVSRDSLSDEVTMPLTSVPSLSPFANSIPANGEERASAASAFDARAAALGTTFSERLIPRRLRISLAGMPMAARRRFTIVGSALGFSALVLAIAGLKSIDRKTVSTSNATVLIPASTPSIPMSDLGETSTDPAPKEEPERSPTFPPPENAPPAATAKAESGASARTSLPASSGQAAAPAPIPARETKSTRTPPKTASSGKGKPKEDPFGLMKPVRSKPKDDPFGL